MRPPGRATRLFLLIIGLTAPFAALFALTVFFPAPTITPATEPAPQSASAFVPDAGWTARPAPAPLFAAADAHAIWLLRPLTLGPEPHSGFEILTRSNNAGDWHILRSADTGAVPYFSGVALGLAAITSPTEANTAYILGTDGQLNAITTDADLTPRDPLPADHRLLALGSAPDGLYAITQGPHDSATTRPGDRLLFQPLPADNSLSAPPTTFPATTPATTPATLPTTVPATLPEPTATTSAPATATAPATTTAASAPALPVLINAYWFRGNAWFALPSLGPLGGPDSPSEAARVAVAASQHRIAVAWVEPAHPRDLLMRSRPEGNATDPWSAVTHIPLDEPVPSDARLAAVTLNDSACIFYAIPDARTFAVLGERWSYNADNSPKPERLPTMVLGPDAAGINPAHDITLAVSETSLVIIVAAPDGTLRSATFGSHGERQSPLQDIAPQHRVLGLQLGENIILLIVAGLMVLSLFRWKNHPRQAQLPFGKRSAGLAFRAAAFLIDLALPFIAVITCFGLWEKNAWLDLLAAWGDALTRPQILLDYPAILWTLAVYTLHVSIGELFFRRSIGKAILGMEVLMVDGKAPTVAAILVRNLIRLAELAAAGLPLFYMCISAYRQRVGDVLAQTVVVREHPPAGSPREGTPP